jgi:L-lactate dehydrogenase complex protein LldG
MSAAREAIFKAIGQATARDTAKISAEARALLDEPETVRPVLPLSNVVDSFIARVSGPKLVGTTVERIHSIADLPAAVARWLAAKGMASGVVIQPVAALQALNWAAAGVAISDTVNEGVAVGLARWGIAETGSLVFHSGADTPILLNFLPGSHIVAVFVDRIVAHLEDYAALAREAGDPAPRNACLITGASGTTDIEGDLVKGAHGPRELHIVVVNGGAC